MKTRIVITCLLHGVVLASLAATADALSPDPAAVVGPYIDSQTIFVGRLAVQQLPLAELQERGVKLVQDLVNDPNADEEIAAAAKQLLSLRDAFVGAGGKEIFVVFSMLDFPNPPFFIITCTASDKIPALEGLVNGIVAEGRPKMEVRRTADSQLLLGTPAVLDRVQAHNGEGRAELTAAWSAAGTAPLQLIVSPSDDQRRVLRETFPQLPPPWQQLTGQAISDGIQWAILSVEMSPSLKARLLVESKDEAAAQQIKQLAVTSLNQLVQLPAVQKMIPTAKDLAALVQPVVEGKQVSIVLSSDAKTVEAVMKPLADAIAAARKNAQRVQSMNNMKQLGLAMHNYYDVHKRFPPAASYDASGKPLLSWRVHILPFIEQKALYDQFKLDEPWDSEHNKKLIDMVVKAYQDPSAGLKPGMTTYLVPIGEGTVFGGNESLRMPDIVDGTSNTIMIVSVTPDRAVPWTKPEDLPVTKADPKQGLFGPGHNTFVATFCDGSVRTIAEAIDNDTLWLLLDAKDQQPIDPDKIR